MKELPWVKKITKESAYVFQQDELQEHTAKTVRDGFEAYMSFWPEEFWPPQIPFFKNNDQILEHDLNPLDFFLWKHIEEKACKTRHR